MKTFSFLIATLFINSLSFSQSFLEGEVYDEESGEALIGASILAYQNDRFVYGVSTDIHGNFRFKLASGKYDIKVSYVGYPEDEFNAVQLEEKMETSLIVGLLPGVTMEEIVIVEYNKPLVEIDSTGCGTRIRNGHQSNKKEPYQKTENLNFQLYPNPTIDHVNIQIQNPVDQINLISITGRVLKSVQPPDSGEVQISLSNLPAGNYFIQAQKGNTLTAKKLIIAKP